VHFPLDAFDQTLYRFRQVAFPRPALRSSRRVFHCSLWDDGMSGKDDGPLAYLLGAIRDPLAARSRRDTLALKMLARLKTAQKQTNEAEWSPMEDARASLARKLAGIGPDQA
jgi:hypothetical protein